MHFIEEKPSFIAVAKVYEDANHVLHCLANLIDDDDTCQRASDLLQSTEELLKQVKLLVNESP
jgi:hypothetical protein